MDDPAATPIARYRNEFRAGLLALGIPFAAIGIWSLVAPHSWYSDFPGSGHHWVSPLGPYNEHSTRDFGGLYLGLGLLLVYAGIFLRRQVVQVALATSLVFAVPHFIFHMTKLEALSTGDNVANMTSLALTVLLPVVLLALSGRASSASEPKVARPATTPIEGGVTYGTR
jgi:hypothetical protein